LIGRYYSTDKDVVIDGEALSFFDLMINDKREAKKGRKKEEIGIPRQGLEYIRRGDFKIS
jgi:hypothetical protein